MSKFVKGLYTVNRAMFFVATLLLTASTFVAAFNVITRKFFHGVAGFTWAEELATYCCVLMLFVGVAFLEFTNKHLTIGIMGPLIKNEKARAIVDQATRILRGIVTLGLLGIVLRYGVVVLGHMYTSNMTTWAMRLPKLYFFIPMLVGFAMVVVIWITILIVYKGKEINYEP